MISRDDFIKKAKADFLESEKDNEQSKWRKNARKDFDFFEGGELEDTGQWDKEDLDILHQQMRPAVTFNVLEKLVEALVGTEVNNRQEPTYQPREDTDRQIAETANEVSKWARDNDVEEEETEALRSTLICGMGATVSTMEYDEDPDGKFQEISIDILGLRWKPKSRRPNLADTPWIGYVEDIPKAKFKEMFPNFKGEIASTVFGRSGKDEEKHTSHDPTDYNDPQLQGVSGSDTPSDSARVLMYECYYLEDFYRIVQQDGTLSDAISGDVFKQTQAKAKDTQIPIPQADGSMQMVTPTFEPWSEGMQMQPFVTYYVTTKQRIYYRGFFNGDVLIDDEPEENPWQQGFTISVITGRRSHNKRTWYGVLRSGKDPQRWSNKMLSVILHIFNTNPKGGILFRKGMFDNPEDIEKNISKPNFSGEWNEGYSSGDIYQLQTTAPPTTAYQFLDRAQNAVPDTTGLSMEFVGLASRDQAVGLEQTRKLATMTIVAPIFSNYRRFKKQQARLLLAFMRDYFTIKTMQRVVSKDNAPAVPQLKTLDVGKFDVHVDQAPLTPSVQATVFSILKDVMQYGAPLFQQSPAVMAALLVPFFENSPLPKAVSDAAVQALQGAMQPDPNAQKNADADLMIKISKAVDQFMDARMKAATADATTAQPDIQIEQINQKTTDSLLNLEQTRMQMAGTLAKEKGNGTLP